MEITGGEIIYNELDKNSKGGTENLGRKLVEVVDPELLKDFQIVLSRVREIDESKIRILWCHDLPRDPESEWLRDKTKHDIFHKYVFVSNWQMQAYIQEYQIPWSKCIVVQNAIEPIPVHEKPKDKINLIYYSTPHRGLELLYPVFNRLCEKYDNIHLDVYSSFDIYGWGQRDKPYEKLFEDLNNHKHISYHGTVDNSEIREALTRSHILAYPSIWPETSCLVLMEAMSASLLCVHSNYAALPETAANWTMMYHFDEDPNRHAGSFYQVLDMAITNYNHEFVQERLKTQKSYTDVFYGWNGRTQHWTALLQSIKAIVGDDRSLPKIEEVENSNVVPLQDGLFEYGS